MTTVVCSRCASKAKTFCTCAEHHARMLVHAIRCMSDATLRRTLDYVEHVGQLHEEAARRFTGKKSMT